MNLHYVNILKNDEYNPVFQQCKKTEQAMIQLKFAYSELSYFGISKCQSNKQPIAMF